MSNLGLVTAAAAVVTGATAQSVAGIGFSLVAGPLLFATFGARDGVRVSLALSLLVNVVVLAREYRRILWRKLLPVLVAAVVTTPVAARLLSGAPPRAALIAAGLATVCGAGMVAIGFRPTPSYPRAATIGVASAVMNVLASASGPAVAVYAAAAGWDSGAARSTLQAYFLVLNVVAIATLGVPSASGPQALTLLAALIVGSSFGAWLAARASAAAARQLALAVAILSGASLAAAALAG